MRAIHDAVLGVHIACGAVALIVFWVPAFTKKGGRVHRRAGWAYVSAMIGVVATVVPAAMATVSSAALNTCVPPKPMSACVFAEANEASGESSFMKVVMVKLPAVE